MWKYCSISNEIAIPQIFQIFSFYFFPDELVLEQAFVRRNQYNSIRVLLLPFLDFSFDQQYVLLCPNFSIMFNINPFLCICLSYNHKSYLQISALEWKYVAIGKKKIKSMKFKKQYWQCRFQWKMQNSAAHKLRHHLCKL